MATINPSTESITATVSLQIGTDNMGQLVSDGTLDYVWVTDETNGTDALQNLNLAVSDPASQPYVTSVGGTSLGHGAAQNFGPPPTETTWNDALYYSEGAGGGGISETFAMPDYQQALGVVGGSSGTPCANSGGDCREVPDVSADADPSSGYIVYDTVDGFGGWNALGGTSGATPLWAAVLAVVASADGNSAGYGALNPALYLLAQRSPSTYLNDVTVGRQRLQRYGRRSVPGHVRIRHGHRARHARGVRAGVRAHHHSADRCRLGHPGLRRVADLQRDSQLCGLRQRALRRHSEHERSHLRHRGLLHGHRSVPGRRAIHRPGLFVQRSHVLRRRWVRLFARLHEHGE